MSNRATILPTKFESIRTGKESYGVRVYDDYGKTYMSGWDLIPVDDLEIIQKVMDEGDDISISIIDNILELKKGIYVGDNWYEWDDIKHLFED